MNHFLHFSFPYPNFFPYYVISYHRRYLSSRFHKEAQSMSIVSVKWKYFHIRVKMDELRKESEATKKRSRNSNIIQKVKLPENHETKNELYNPGLTSFESLLRKIFPFFNNLPPRCFPTLLLSPPPPPPSFTTC